MVDYYIDNVIIKGHAFHLNEPLTLHDAIELAREFSNHDYIYHIKERISGNRFKHVSLSELELRLMNYGNYKENRAIIS